MYVLRGRVHNRSSHGLRGVILKITMRDKLLSGESEVIGEKGEYISVTVHPEQTRELSGLFDFDNLPSPRGHLEWSYVITELGAE